MNRTELFKKLKIDKALRPYMVHYLDWLEENVDKIIASEMTLVHEDGYAGTTDMHCVMKGGKEAVVDYKTQNVRAKPVFYDKFCEQLVAYRACFDKPDSMSCVSVVIDSNDPAPCVQKVWDDKKVETAEAIFGASLKIWQSAKKYAPEKEGE